MQKKPRKKQKSEERLEMLRVDEEEASPLIAVTRRNVVLHWLRQCAKDVCFAMTCWFNFGTGFHVFFLEIMLT